VINNLTARLRASLRSRGVGGTARKVGGRGRLKALQVRDYGREVRFDRVHGVSTRGVRRHLAAPEGSHDYQGVRAGVFLSALGTVPVDRAKFTFVDFGCGKGAALVLAAQQGFAQVIGVEFDPAIAAVGARNLRESPTVLRSRSRAEVICADATDFVLPDEPLVVLFYNPFSGAVLQGVVDKLDLSLKATPRDMWVVYINPLEKERFENSIMLREVASHTETQAPRSRPGDRYAIYRAISHAA
jgi:SAM-dependent methyltransferase